MRTLAVLPEVHEEACEFTDDGQIHDLFEGYQSNSDDEYYSDSGDKVSGAKLARVMKSNPFKQLVGCPIRPFKNEHTCHRIYKSREARAKWITGKFQDLVISNPGIQPGVISHLLRDQFNVTVDSQRLYKVRKMALEVLLKDHKACFKHLRAYAIMVQQCNPGLAAYIHLMENTIIFKRIFQLLLMQTVVCTHLLIASVKEKHFSTGHGFYSRFCTRHIYANFKTSYGGQKLKRLFWRASKTVDRFEFKKLLADISAINSKAMAYPTEIEPCRWSRHAFDASIKCESVTNNMTEAFNSMLKDFRPKTYLQLMEFIRILVMSRFQLRKNECKHLYGVNGDEANLGEFIDPILSKSAYLRTYNSMIHPIPDLCVWVDFETSKVDPPPVKRLPGRPRLVRKREEGRGKRESGEKQKAEKKVSNTADDVSVSSSQGATTSSQPSTKRQRAPKSKAAVGSSSQPTQYFDSTSAYVSCNMNFVNYENVATKDVLEVLSNFTIQMLEGQFTDFKKRATEDKPEDGQSRRSEDGRSQRTRHWCYDSVIRFQDKFFNIQYFKILTSIVR
ncbi:hypothetical protein EZV62_004044 [Acer yangbiense]|uniref:Uncharacterized protein n=1 Tax=Acer yangbiense TaxID=1000413 RepID=A0A5C7IJ69_9ROSI|nr:hypothetical protein EZV62_004044 [Acer yangbiense]